MSESLLAHACYGRSRDIQSLVSRLGTVQKGTAGSAAVIGEPGFGKTNFFEVFQDPEVLRNELRQLTKSLRLVFVATPESEQLREDRLLGLLRDAIMGEHRPLEQTDPCSAEAFEGAVRSKILDHGRGLVLFIDDFERIPQNPAFTAPFFSFLRYLGYHLKPGVAFVLSSSLDIGDMAIKHDVQASPFWNIFSTIRLTPLSAESSTKLIAYHLKDVSDFDHEHHAAIARLSGGLPAVAHSLTTAAKRCLREGLEPQSERLLIRAAEEMTPTLDRIWRKLPPTLHEALGAMLTRPENLSGLQRDHLLTLERRGYLIPNTLEVRSPLLSWDWSRRLGLERVPSCSSMVVIPPLRSPGLLRRWFSR